MAFTFETSGNNTFLVYAIQENDVLDTMTLGMITNNRIPGMVPVLYTQMNRDCFLKYNVTAKVTVKQFFSGIVNRRRLLGVFSGVTAALAAAQEYMIDVNSLLLDTGYMYADVSACRAEVICLPVVRKAESVACGLFFKNIMFSTQFDQTENCDYVARIINYLNSMPVFVAEDFQRLLEELQGEPYNGGAVSQAQVISQAWQSGGLSQAQTSPGGAARLSASPQDLSQPQTPGGAPQAQTLAQSPQSAGPPQSDGSAASRIRAVFQPRQQAPSPGKQGSAAAAGRAFAGQDGGFAVPGQEGAGFAGQGGGFAVPGQEGAGFAGQDGGFAVPGQERAGFAGQGGGFAVPGQERAGFAGQAGGKRQKKTQKTQKTSSSEKEISIFYLLQHYNKENAAAYKAQKEARKKGGEPSASASSAPGPAFGFAVPGQQAQFQQPQSQEAAAQSQSQKAAAQSQSQLSPAQSRFGSASGQSQTQAGQWPYTESRQAGQAPSGGDNFGDTVVMGADGYGEDTVVIGEVAAAAIQPYLRRLANNEKILLDKPVFRIGKERSYVDYCVSGNATISRSHADIINRGGQFFIVDNNSTNHTYVNGEMIPSNTEIPLSHGTRLRLSNEEFEFLTF